ncbi:MAG: hypothetical protein ACUVV0_07960 [Anaerolineae bacterium]
MESLPFKVEAENQAGEYSKSVSLTIRTLEETVDQETLLELSRLTLVEIKELQKEIAEIFPASNLPALLLQGMVRLKGRVISADRARKDILALFQFHKENLLSRGLYGVFVAGPAAILVGYQKLLTLAGKDPASAFPQGTWQFYLEFGLREDTARHTSETIGFHKAIPPKAKEIDMFCAWAYQAALTLFEYDDLLENEWLERTLIHLAQEVAQEEEWDVGTGLRNLAQDWGKMRPYEGPPGEKSYPGFRQRLFRAYFQERIAGLSRTSIQKLWARYETLRESELPAYQEQMSILHACHPSRYREERKEIPIWQARLGIVFGGRYYLMGICRTDEADNPLLFTGEEDEKGQPLTPVEGSFLRDEAGRLLRADRRGNIYLEGQSKEPVGRLRPISPAELKRRVAAILEGREKVWEEAPSEVDLLLTSAPRSAQEELRAALGWKTSQEIKLLDRAPIIINWDLREAKRTLGEIRRSHRGLGDHALTIFRTERSFVFDQSHIFFDGLWGMALAEILTRGAVGLYGQFASLELEEPSRHLPLIWEGSGPEGAIRRLKLAPSPKFEAAVVGLTRIEEVVAESWAADLRRLTRLRGWLRERGADLTINDLLVLWRTIYDRFYSPSPQLVKALEDSLSGGDGRNLALEQAINMVRSEWERLRKHNPSLLIPMDASWVKPGERLFPTTFRNPFVEIAERLNETYQALEEHRRRQDEATRAAFLAQRKELMAYLRYFGAMMYALKQITRRGESFSTAVTKLLANLPEGMQYVLDLIPQKIEVLNEIIKGEEVFSNAGRVAAGSSLSRFLSAKDDGEAKRLVWGIMTDDRGRLYISLRDFREHVRALIAAGQEGLARAIAQDYVDGFATGLNKFAAELSKITIYKTPHNAQAPGNSEAPGT